MTRAEHIHHARVNIAMARTFRQRAHAQGANTGWACKLLGWAANARRRANAEPVQRGLFELREQVAA